MSNFRVDVLLKALKELQDEKNQNEQLLAEECSKCKKLELKAETVMSTLSSISEKHAKAKESVRMEEQRVDHTQQQIKQYEEVNDGVRLKITKLNQQIEQSKEERRINMDAFEEEMSQLREKFLSGWKNTMESTMEDYEEERLKLMEEGDAHQSKLSLLKGQIEAEQGHSSEQQDIVPTTTWEEVCQMFKAENLASKAVVDRKKQQLHLEDLEKELACLLEETELPEKELTIQREP